MDALAISYARELTSWGIETSIIVPGVFITGTNHFAHAEPPDDQKVADQYEAGPYVGLASQVRRTFDAMVPRGADASAVADAVVIVVDSPFFGVQVDPTGSPLQTAAIRHSSETLPSSVQNRREESSTRFLIPPNRHEVGQVDNSETASKAPAQQPGVAQRHQKPGAAEFLGCAD